MMGKSALKIASELARAAEQARLEGDVAASISIAVVAAQYNRLARLLADEPSPEK